MLHEYKPDSPYQRLMPPLAGTKRDVDDLTDLLNAQVNLPASNAKNPALTAMK
jgi:hypothetical protein